MKILAVASGGGHWIELLRLIPAIKEHDLEFICTNSSFANTVSEYPFHVIPDFSMWNKTKMFSIGYKVHQLFSRIKPDVIITTGAAPGALCLWIAKLRGIKTIWIESLCHAEKISVSGRICSTFADRCYTQWDHLAKGKFIYAGNVLI